MKDFIGSYCHPYLHELNMFRVPSCQLMNAKPIPPSDINNYDNIVMVDDEKSLANMIADLKNVNELAVDSEVNEITILSKLMEIRGLLIKLFLCRSIIVFDHSTGFCASYKYRLAIKITLSMRSR